MSSPAVSSKHYSPCIRANPLTEHTSLSSLVNKRGNYNSGAAKPPNIKSAKLYLQAVEHYVRKKSNQGKIKVNFGNRNKISEGRYDNYVNGKKNA